MIDIASRMKPRFIAELRPVHSERFHLRVRLRDGRMNAFSMTGGAPASDGGSYTQPNDDNGSCVILTA
jgi:hypothetical protein